MFEKLEIFRMANAMAVHAGTRQAVVAQNMANADTPGYDARDVRSFAEVLDLQSAGFSQRATRNSHLNGTVSALDFEVGKRDGGVSDPNGNSVSLETEMLEAVDVKRQHDRAVAIYKSSLNILHTALRQR